VRNGVGVGEDAAKNVSSWADGEEVQRLRIRRHTYVGARRPCTAFLGRRVRKWNARNAIAQAFIA